MVALALHNPQLQCPTSFAVCLILGQIHVTVRIRLAQCESGGSSQVHSALNRIVGFLHFSTPSWWSAEKTKAREVESVNSDDTTKLGLGKLKGDDRSSHWEKQ